ncbi:cytochrome P450 [Auriscalpium vulgare]|uniref:Cytochrome P450 n=1 Tax=Auriscalpium vulgare TaxID=40419 RepID=A0ACB8RWU4_9AGAM|nr:cytochrome P450 [Auriscalpium vulgare]
MALSNLSIGFWVPSSTTVLVACLCLALTLFITRLVSARKGQLPLPPGPKIPIVGSLLHMPRKEEWKTITAWKERYGDVVHATIGTRSLIILNSLDAVTDLLEKRSARYSDRPWLPLIDLIGHIECDFGYMPYGKNWAAHRRLFSTQFAKSTLPAYYPSHRRAVLAMLRNFLTEPEAFVDHLRLHAGQLIIDVTYGIQISSRTDRLVVLGGAVMDAMSVAITPVMWIVNPVSFLQSIPSWLGGRNLAQKVRGWQEDLHALLHVPFNRVKSDIASGAAAPSFTARLLQEIDEQKPDPEQETLIMNCAAAAYMGGSDTTLSVAHIFVLAMVLHPAVQRTAQLELDRVVGAHRLPDFSDRTELPYIEAIVKEVLRWHPIGPQGVPHGLIDDDEYRGYRIPKGSLIVGNMWAILHDSAIYVNPHEFTPERHLDDGKNVPEMDPVRVSFGFGRR